MTSGGKESEKEFEYESLCCTPETAHHISQLKSLMQKL